MFLALVYQICCTISAILCQLKEPFNIFFHAVSEASHPEANELNGDRMFDKVSEFDEIVEKKTVCRSCDKMAAVALTFAIYYIFHVDYSCSQSSIITFFKTRSTNYKLNPKNFNIPLMNFHDVTVNN